MASDNWVRSARDRVTLAMRSTLRRDADLGRSRLELLARIGELNEIDLDTATRFEALLDAMLPDIADACAIFLIENEALHLASARHVQAGRQPALADPALRGPFSLQSSHPTSRAVRTRRPVLDTRTDEQQGATLRQLRIGSLLTVPLMRRDESVGALLLAFDAKRKPCGPDDITFAVELARRVTASLTIARQHEQERIVAETLQESLLPRELPRITGLDIAGRYLGASRGIYVGGDWYDVVDLGGGRVAVAIGDVVGHGLSAANAMGRLRAGLHLCMIDGLGPADALDRLNHYSFSFDESDMATVQIAIVDVRARQCRFASAGHPPPVLVTSGGRSLLDGGLGVPVGTSASATYHETDVALEEDSLLLLYTDGLVERRGESLTVGLDRLLAEARLPRGTLDDLLDQLLDRLLPEEGGEDDVALVALHVVPPFALDVPAAPGELLELRNRLRAWLDMVGAGFGEVNDIVVAVNEAAANVIEHAQGSSDGRLRVHGDVDGDDVVIMIPDQGRWRPIEASEERGRGIRLMRELMDDVTVTPGSTTARGTTVELRVRLNRDRA